MNLSIEHTLPIDGKGNYIASLTIVNPTDMQAHNLQTRVGRRIAAKTKRTPELVREGFITGSDGKKRDADRALWQ